VRQRTALRWLDMAHAASMNTEIPRMPNMVEI
jgi:hypothetical protein